MDGWLNIYKQPGSTSYDVIRALKKLLKVQKIGHLGTLDPFASGILPIALGEATKLMPYILELKKSYVFTIEWGRSTDTQDITGTIISQSDRIPNVTEVRDLLPSFVGKIHQIPPRFSAIKVGGKRAYTMARNQEDFELQSREVEIFSLELSGFTDNTITLTMECGKGTYVRAIARDLAHMLAADGCVSELTRINYGNFAVHNSISVIDLREAIDYNQLLDRCFYPFTQAFDQVIGFLPKIELDAIEAQYIKNGKHIELEGGETNKGREFASMKSVYASETNGGEITVCMWHQNKPLAIGKLKNNTLAPIRVFNT